MSEHGAHRQSTSTIDRVTGLIDRRQIVVSAANVTTKRASSRRRSLTARRPPDSPIMQEEIFGPVLPVLHLLTRWTRCIGFIRSRRKAAGALSLHEDRADERRSARTPARSAAAASTTPIVHLATPHMPLRRRRRVRHGVLPREAEASRHVQRRRVEHPEKGQLAGSADAPPPVLGRQAAPDPEIHEVSKPPSSKEGGGCRSMPFFRLIAALNRACPK